MKNLKEVLNEQKKRKGNGCATYKLIAQDIFSSCKNTSLQHSDADYFIRISVKSMEGILMNSKLGAKMKYFAVKDGEIFHTAFFAPDYRYIKTGQWVWEITDFIGEEKNQKLADAIIKRVQNGEKVTISHNNYDRHLVSL